MYLDKGDFELAKEYCQVLIYSFRHNSDLNNPEKKEPFENIMGIEENADKQHFLKYLLLFAACFLLFWLIDWLIVWCLTLFSTVFQFIIMADSAPIHAFLEFF